MPRRQGMNRFLHPVKSYKHVVDSNGLVTNVVSVTDLVTTKDNPVLSGIADVQTACTVSSIYLNVGIVNFIASGGVPRFYFIVFKNPGTSLIIPNPATVGSSKDKKFVIHQEMIMLNNSVAPNVGTFPRTMFKGVIRIPRGYKRMGALDKLQFAIITPDATGQAEFCVQCIYKEFR